MASASRTATSTGNTSFLVLTVGATVLIASPGDS